MQPPNEAGRIERWIIKRNLALLAGDAVGFAALVSGSVKSRCIVL